MTCGRIMRALLSFAFARGVHEFSRFHAAPVKRWVAFVTEVGLRK
jgi:hypothetical protein